MCKTCANTVHTVVKNRGSVYILCAAIVPAKRLVVHNSDLPASHPHLASPTFSTAFFRLTNLFSRQLSTLSTVPITNTTIYTK